MIQALARLNSGLNTPGERRYVRSSAMVLGVATLWGLTHHFLGFTADGEIYGVQAFARLHPHLFNDLYLANPSQDRLSIFSPLYAMLMRLLNPPAAAVTIFALCTISFLVAAWWLVRRLADDLAAWLAVALLTCTTLPYGGNSVFKIAEDYLTARSLAEALVVTALASYYSGPRWVSVLLVLIAFSVHPLMALPGLLLLACLMVPLRVAVVASVAGALSVATLAFAVAHGYVTSRFLVLMDPSWLEVVRERSQFLFLKYWSFGDYEAQLRPFLCLTFTMICLPDSRIKTLCKAAALVGIAGLITAEIAGSVGPIAIFLQAQTWRWCWVTSFLALSLLAPTLLHLWRIEGCGRLCAVLLMAGLTFPAVNETALICAALLLWTARAHISEQRNALLNYAAYGLIVIIGVWTTANLWQLLGSETKQSTIAAVSLDVLRGAFTLRTFAIFLFGVLLYAVDRFRFGPPAALVSTAAVAIAVLPGAIQPTWGFAGFQEFDQVSDWRAVIPESSTVLVVPAKISSAFQWFALERASYLTLSQSAGAVFSPVTAAEIRRRSEVLKPVTPEDWRILSQSDAKRRGVPKETPIPLTAENLQKICADPQLGFVVAKETLGFGAFRETRRGPWKDWNLYDCRLVRAADTSV